MNKKTEQEAIQAFIETEAWKGINRRLAEKINKKRDIMNLPQGSNVEVYREAIELVKEWLSEINNIQAEVDFELPEDIEKVD